MVKSTRKNIVETPSQAILDGLAKDGGLYVFDIVKQLDLASLLGKSYQDVAEAVFCTLLTDFSIDSIKKIITTTYNDSLFIPSPVTLEYQNDFAYLNLYHGSTFAFKDMALSILPKLVEEAKKINNVNTPNLVLTATSGDTGSAALAGFSRLENDHVIVLYPTVGVSEFQELQMNNFKSDKLHVYAVEGNFDDCQNIVKKLFTSIKTKNVQLTSANSINIGRIIPQVVYYIYSYLQLVENGKVNFDNKEPINFCVPTGNFGNIYAAHLAGKMGVPINKLIVASNENDVLHQFFETGIYKVDRELHKTMSPSMDIIISSNLERYIYELLEGNYELVNSKMEELSIDGLTKVFEVLYQKLFFSGSASEDLTLAAIKEEFQTSRVLIDPHTAVAKAVYSKYKKEKLDDSYTVIVSTASPYKFSDSVLKALDLKQSNLTEDIKTLSNYTNAPFDDRILKTLTTSKFKNELKKEDAFDFLKKVIGDIDDNKSTSY